MTKVRILLPELHADCIARESTVPRATALTVGRQRHGEDGANDKRIVDDDDAIAACSAIATMPLLRRWSARSAEAREVLVRFQRVARSYAGKATGVALLFQRSNSQLRSLVALARHPSMLTSKVGSTPASGAMKTTLARSTSSVSVSGRRCSTVGHLTMDQANNRQQHSPRSRGIRCVSTSKVGSTPAFSPSSPP
jgi:hypothetical protein